MGGSQTSTDNSQPSDSRSNGGKATAASPDCSPQKKVVPQGGTTDPDPQLAGGASGQKASQERSTSSDLLGRADENLKKIASRQLTPAQQDEVAQVHQFMAQSKAATADGDLDRAHTLAWKAQMLSEELLSPQK
jgi:hypothetical protein